MVGVKLLGMLPVAAFSLTVFPLKRVAGFTIASRCQRGYTGFPSVNKVCKKYNFWRGERLKNDFATTTRLWSSVLTGENVKRNIADDESEEEILSNKVWPGTIEGFSITKMYKIDRDSGFDMEKIKDLVDSDELSRLELTPMNISVPVALMLLDPEEYPTKSRARKACRKANIMIHRGSLDIDEETGEEVVDPEKCVRARVGFRVFPGDILCKQIRIGDGKMPMMSHPKPPFELPVVFEDDHFAIVNKPEGVVVYAKRGSGQGVMTIRAAIPFAVAPSQAGTYCTLRRPQPVHRLDKPTSGLLIVAKTKPAMVNLSHQFRDRKVKKTYTAIVNGIPPEPIESKISAKEAHRLGVDVDASDEDEWQLIDYELDEKSAVTIWKATKYSNSVDANSNILTTVALKPKTGKYHQLRRHLSLVCECPIVGDNEYDGGGAAMNLRERGLFLCSNKVTLEHPFYNDLKEGDKSILGKLPEKEQDGLWLSKEGKVMVTASIEPPEKFDSFVSKENDRFAKVVSSEVF